jgi:hypothetical protein
MLVGRSLSASIPGTSQTARGLREKRAINYGDFGKFGINDRLETVALVR